MLNLAVLPKTKKGGNVFSDFNFLNSAFSFAKKISSPFVRVTREMDETMPSAHTLIDKARYIGANTFDNAGEETFWIAFPEDRLYAKGYTKEELKKKVRRRFREINGL